MPLRAPRCPYTYVAESLLALILGMGPLAFVALFYGLKVRRLFFCGDFDAAIERSRKAAFWMRWTLISGFTFWIIYVLFFLTGSVSNHILTFAI